MRSYLDTLPVADLSSLIYWDTATLNEVDSQIIRQNYKTTCDHYKAIYQAMIVHPESPYSNPAASQPPISEEEFLWAFSTVSARALVFNNEHVAEMNDPNAFTMIVPLFDMVNHSREPNCVVLPYHDKLSDQSFVSLQSLRDIGKDEQLTISYGNDLANTHLIQKYGFVTRDNPVKKVITNMPFHEFDTIVYEEMQLKQEQAKKHKLPYVQNGLHNAIFYNYKFPIEVLKQVRLSFLTSKTLLENGGKSYLDDKDFSEALDQSSE